MTKTMRRFFFCICIFLPFVFISVSNAYAQQASIVTPAPVKSNNEDYSAKEMSVGETITIKGELSNVGNKLLTISSISVSDETESASSHWEIVNATSELALNAGEKSTYVIVVKALKDGIFRLHPLFHINDYPDKLGVGQTLKVYPDDVRIYKLVVDGSEFYIKYEIQEPYMLTNMTLDKQQKLLVTTISSDENIPMVRILTIWIPIDLINDKGTGDNIDPSRTMKLQSYGSANINYIAIGSELGDEYVINIPPNTRSLQIAMTGSNVIPEFSMNHIAIALALATSIPIILFRSLKDGYNRRPK